MTSTQVFFIVYYLATENATFKVVELLNWRISIDDVELPESYTAKWKHFTLLITSVSSSKWDKFEILVFFQNYTLNLMFLENNFGAV